MKRILFYYSQLNIGGAEKSLARLMNLLAAEGHDVTYLGRYCGGNAEYLLDRRIKKLWLSHPLSNGGKFERLFSMARAWAERIGSRLKLRKLREFDIAFIGKHGLSPQFIIKNVRTKKLCTFVRNDVAKSKGKALKTLREYLDVTDNLICVASTVRDSVVKAIPEAECKAIVIYNILDAADMRRKIAESPTPFANEVDDCFRIVSVCRMSDTSKGLYRMVRVCRRLVDSGLKFRWYVVGDGADLPAMRKMISEKGLNDVMLTPGRVDNPFGYYRDCNLVAMLSYYEGLCGVVNEAKISGKAIIATEVSGIHEQLEHGINGWIVDNNEQKILEGMKHLIKNPDLVESLTNSIYPEALTDDYAKLRRILSLAD